MVLQIHPFNNNSSHSSVTIKLCLKIVKDFDSKNRMIRNGIAHLANDVKECHLKDCKMGRIAVIQYTKVIGLINEFTFI